MSNINNYAVNEIAVIVRSVIDQAAVVEIANELGIRDIQSLPNPRFKPEQQSLACLEAGDNEEAAFLAAAFETWGGVHSLTGSAYAQALAAGIKGAVSGKQAVFAHNCLTFAKADLEKKFSAELAKKAERLKELVVAGKYASLQDAEAAMRESFAKHLKMDGLDTMTASQLIDRFKSVIPEGYGNKQNSGVVAAYNRKKLTA
ncbi:hypothetical protein [Aquabacterium sp.]|uniref:hypothetical protein n=1 Tax=Aquabacterium sp. TaxID=1872578 RepID=UPI003BAFBD71